MSVGGAVFPQSMQVGMFSLVIPETKNERARLGGDEPPIRENACDENDVAA